ncbi:MAG TPA: galactose oxidase-like domain-containing protein [Pyrinomonadaceae bacterium]
MNFQIKGGVVEQGKRKGIGQVRVEACDVRGFVEDYIAYSLTDDDGSFVITLAQDMVRDMFPRDPLEVFFKVWCGSQLLCNTEDGVHWTTDQPDVHVRIEATKPKPMAWSERHVFLKIERMEGYSPVKPLEEEAAQEEYARDCMRNKGHEDGKIPPAEIQARSLDAIIYREYLDSAYIIPKPDKLIAADVNEPLYENRVPGTVIYAHPDQRLKIHVWNDDVVPHSLHAHGLQYGIDSDGTWPFGTQAGNAGPRSDAICPGETWVYTFDITYDMRGAFAFHDYTHFSNIAVEQGLFGGIVVLDYCDKPPRAFRFRPGILEGIYNDLAKSEGREFFAKGAERVFDEDCAPFMLERAIHVKRFKEETRQLLEHHLDFLEEFTSREFSLGAKHIPTDHVPVFFHRMARKETAAEPPPPKPPRPPILDVDLVLNQQRQLFEAAANIVRGPVDLVVNPGLRPFPFPFPFPFPLPLPPPPIPSLCINGRSFVGNTPTIVARAGQRIRWYIFNLDISSNAHNFHAHGMRWTFAGENIDTRSFGPGEAFIVEATVPPVLLLTEAEARCQLPEHRPKDAEFFTIRGDFLFHCHEHEHLLAGMAGLVRSIQSLWLTPVMADDIRRRTGLPIDNGLNACPEVEPNPCGPETIGRWTLIDGAPETLLMHSILLPNTQRVLFWGQTRTDQARIWDYSTPAGSFLSPANQTADLTGDTGTSDMWSSGHAILDTPEGLVLIHGGFSPNRAFTFNPITTTYTQVANTAGDRFYPTTLVIGDGRAVTLFGSASKSFEVFTPGGGWSAPIAVPATMFHHQYYPWTYLLPSGLLFIAGPHTPSQGFDFNTPAGVETLPSGKGNRSTGGEKGSSVMLILRPPDYKPIVYRMGGNVLGIEKSVEQIDLSVTPTPTWSDLPDFKNARAEQFTATLLPDGRVFVAGGISGGVDGGPCEILDPRASTPEWIEGPNMAFERTYHSSFLLLPDGSILGGGAPPNVAFPPFTAHERFFPGYFERVRPVISGAPPAINYAGNFTINTPTPLDIGEVVLLRAGAVTHGFNMSQRGIELVITGTGPGSLTVATPPSANHMPPGWHLLFILDFDRVPSEGRWIRLTP